MDNTLSELLEALRAVAEGGTCGHDVLMKIASPDEARQSLTGPAKEAYWALWRWSDDADIRSKERGGIYEAGERSKLLSMYLRLSNAGKTVT